MEKMFYRRTLGLKFQKSKIDFFKRIHYSLNKMYKIYKIVCNETEEVYIGKTMRTLEERLRQHKNCLDCSSKQIILRENYNIIKIDECDTEKESIILEARYIRNTDNCVNKCIPGRTVKEYYEENKDKLNEKHKEYREENRDKIKEKSKEYYEAYRDEIKVKSKEYRELHKDELKVKSKEYRELHKDEIKVKRKEYREKNKDKIKERQKEYREKNKDRILEYREKNKDKISEKKKEWYEKNKDKIKETHKEYREKNKDEILEKHINFINSK